MEWEWDCDVSFLGRDWRERDELSFSIHSSGFEVFYHLLSNSVLEISLAALCTTGWKHRQGRNDEAIRLKGSCA